MRSSRVALCFFAALLSQGTAHGSSPACVVWAAVPPAPSIADPVVVDRRAKTTLVRFASGRQVSLVTYDGGPDYFVEGVARYVDGGKLGFVDRTGAVVVPARFTFVRPFAEGLAAFCDACQEISDGEHTRMVGGRWGFVTHDGRITVPATFDSVSDFDKGHATVVIGGVSRTLDRCARPS